MLGERHRREFVGGAEEMGAGIRRKVLIGWRKKPLERELELEGYGGVGGE